MLLPVGLLTIEPTIVHEFLCSGADLERVFPIMLLIFLRQD